MLDAAQSYDELPYLDNVFAATSPDRLATVALLAGMEPPAPATARVLEIGCGTGANLIALAVAFPGARFLGLDASGRQIDSGRKTVAELGLHNVTLECRDLMTVTRELGTFDYIICHGVLSWVPPVVRDKVFAICQENLAPNGLVYLSYNCYPGWHFQEILRNQFLYHSRKGKTPQEKVQAVREWLAVLREVCEGSEDLFHRVLASFLKDLDRSADSYLFHEYLEGVNQPFYFHEFLEQSAAHGLQYVGEARINSKAVRMKPHVVERVQGFSQDRIEREQYADLLMGQAFRTTLLCHREVRLTPRPPNEIIPRLWVSWRCRPLSATPEVASDKAEEFRTPEGLAVTTAHPLIKGLLSLTHEVLPEWLSHAELLSRLAGRLDAIKLSAPLEEVLPDAVMQCHLRGLVDLHYSPAPFVMHISEFPRANPLARRQAQNGQNEVANLNLVVTILEAFDRVLLPLLDGTRNRAQLLRELRELGRQGVISLAADGKELQDETAVQQALEARLNQGLETMARCALLLA